MKLTLWQQFSSNHSAQFTIVGQFNDDERAIKAADELRHILKVIADWYKAHPELEDSLRDGDSPPTEPELQFSKQYGIDWGETTLLWFWQVEVTTYNNLVFVDPDGQADEGAYPFNQLMTKLGGQTFVDGEIFRDYVGKEVSADVSCIAPDEATAQAIFDEINAYFAPQSDDVWSSPRAFYKVAPWELYGRKYHLPYVRDVLTAINRNPQDEPVEALREVTRTVIPLLGIDSPTPALIKNLITSYSRLTDYGYEVFIDADKLINALDDVVRLSLFFSPHFAGGNIERNGKHLRLHGLYFRNIAHGFPAMLRYLEDKRCSDIQYQLSENDLNDD